MKNLSNRKPNRLKGYDYAGNGAYFITICTKGRKCILFRIPVGNAGGGVPYGYIFSPVTQPPVHHKGDPSTGTSFSLIYCSDCFLR